MSDEPEVIRSRAIAVLDFLSDLYALKYAPVRRVDEHGMFVGREDDFFDVAGLTFGEGKEDGTGFWVRHTLLTQEAPPALPARFESWTESRSHPTQRPRFIEPEVMDLEEDDHDEGESSDPDPGIRAAFEDWLAEVWLPWERRAQVISRSRGLYRELFELRTLLEQSSDTNELRLGLWNLTWGTGAQRFDHPVLSCPLEIGYDDRSGALTLKVTSGLELEYELFGEVDLTDREGMAHIRRGLEEAQPSPWDAGPELTEIAERVGRAIHHDARVIRSTPDGPAPRSSDGPQVREGWTVFARRKPTDYKGFVEGLRDAYSNGAEIPTPFASVVAEEPSTLAAETGGSWDPPGGKALLPLPANEEQHRILERINHANGVTAQGPPGTGKSHTIANLISHFVAVGKRVLVVAEKEQALTVLLEKVPDDIRDLCVAVLGTDSASKARIEHSIRSIYDGAFGLNQSEAQREIDLMITELAKIDADTEELERQIRSAVAAEGSHDPKTGRTPSDLGRWLRSEQERLSFIPDAIGSDANTPITSAEAMELFGLLTDLAPEDRAAAMLQLPPDGTLPLPDELAALDQRREALTAGLRAVEQWVPSANTTATPLETLEQLASELEQLAPHRAAAEHLPWAMRIEHELDDPGLAQMWAGFIQAAGDQRDQLLATTTAVQGALVVLPDTRPLSPAQLDLLRQARELFAAGRSFGRFGNKEARALLPTLSVAGHPPTTAQHVHLCELESDRRLQRDRLRALWNEQLARVGGPTIADDHDPTYELQDGLTWLSWILGWQNQRAQLEQRVRQVGWTAPLQLNAEGLRHTAHVVRSLAVRHEVAQLELVLSETTTTLAEGTTERNASPLWQQLHGALLDKDWDRYGRVRSEVERLRNLFPQALRARFLHEALIATLPLYAEQLLIDRSACGDPMVFEEAFSWRQAETWLNEIRARSGAGELQAQVVELTRQHQRLVERVVAKSAWLQLSLQFTDSKRQALAEWIEAHKKYGKGTGKHAARWQGVAKQAMDRAKDAVPVWVMPVNTVIRSFKPGDAPPFDVLIVDEASQCGLFTLPLLALARKTIIVGDDKQTSPENVGFNRDPVHQLIEQHLREVPNRQTLFDLDTSLYDVAGQKFPGVVMLREHFRCLPDIIGYSSQAFYNDKIECLRDRAPSPGWRAVESVLVPDGLKHRKDDSNPEEAEAVVGRIEKMVLDPDYDDMTMGVVTLLGKGQAKLIDGMLLDRLGPQTVEERRIRCGDPAAFQGDERDIVLLSVVAAANADGGRIGAMTGLPAQRRINVAASRARNQMIVFHSVPPEGFPANDPRSDLIRHCSEPRSEEISLEGLADRCESALERDVLEQVLARGYERVRVQHPVGSYRIDIVVEGRDARLAIECDGDRWQGDAHWDHERARQRVLERVGWRFVRVRGSAFYRDPDVALEPLWHELDRLGILNAEDEEHVLQTARNLAELAHTQLAEQPPTTSSFIDSALLDAPDAMPPVIYSYEELAVDLDEELRLLVEPEPSLAERDADAREHAVTVGQPTEMTPGDEPPEALGDVKGMPTSGRPHEIRIDAQVRVAPYRAWVPRAVAHVESADPAQVAEILTEIVQIEGPIIARRAYQLYNLASGGRRLGKNVKSAFNRALRRAIADGSVEISEDGAGYIDGCLFAPGSPPVVVRELGTRDFYEVPKPEIAALAASYGFRDLSSAEAKRRVLDAYRVKRLTLGIAEHLESCFTSPVRSETSLSAQTFGAEDEGEPLEAPSAHEVSATTAAVGGELHQIVVDRCRDESQRLLTFDLLERLTTSGCEAVVRPSARTDDGKSDRVLIKAHGTHVATLFLRDQLINIRLAPSDAADAAYARSLGLHSAADFATQVPLTEDGAVDDAIMLVERAARG